MLLVQQTKLQLLQQLLLLLQAQHGTVHTLFVTHSLDIILHSHQTMELIQRINQQLMVVEVLTLRLLVIQPLIIFLQQHRLLASQLLLPLQLQQLQPLLQPQQRLLQHIIMLLGVHMVNATLTMFLQVALQ